MMHRKGLKHIIDTTSLDKKKVYLPFLRGSYLDEGTAHRRDPLSSWLEDEDLYDHVMSFTSLDLPAWSQNPAKIYFLPNATNQTSLTYPEHPLSPEACALVAQLPMGFQKIALQCTLSIEMLTILHRASKVQNLLTKAASCSVTTEELKYLHTYQPENEFHEGFNCFRRLPSDFVTLENCLCLAVVAFTNMAYNVMQFGSLWQQLREGLVQAVLKCTVRDDEEECFIWAMMMATWSWEGRIGLQEPGRSVLNNMLAHYASTRTWDGMRVILKHFFWNEDLGQQWQRCWMQADGAERST